MKKPTVSRRVRTKDDTASVCAQAPMSLRAVLSSTWGPAVNAMPRDILEATTQQFIDRTLLYRELAQNSQDSGAKRIDCAFRMENAEADGFDFVADWCDNGSGMTRAVVDGAYLRIFSSTKEGTRNETVGYFSLGRLVVFAFVPGLVVQETTTLPVASGEEGTFVRLFPDGSGEVYALDRPEAMAQFGPAMAHGTRVVVRYRLKGGAAEFVAEVEKSLASLRKECRWIRPRLTATTVRLEAGGAEGRPASLVSGTEVINQSFGVPGRLSKTFPFELSSGAGKGTVSVGIRPDDKDPAPDLGSVTLTAGGIPLERTSGFPWCGGHDFWVSNLRIAVDSYQWRPPIGRHRVKREEAFFREVVPKVWTSIILGRYVPFLCDKLKDPRERRGLFGYLRNLETMIFDLLHESTRGEGFAIPDCLLELPLFRQYGSWGRKLHSVRELDAAPHFFFTSQKPELADYREVLDSPTRADETTDNIVLDLFGVSFAKTFLLNRYGSKAEEVTEHFFVEPETSTAGTAVQRLFQSAALRAHLPFRHLTVHAARFVRLGQGHVPETRARALVQKERHQVALNLNSPDVGRLVRLATQGATEEDRWLGAHFLLREVLLAEGADPSERKRQQSLQEHCASRHAPPPPSGASPRRRLPLSRAHFLRTLLDAGILGADDVDATVLGEMTEDARAEPAVPL